jgi:hypothetical protein
MEGVEVTSEHPLAHWRGCPGPVRRGRGERRTPLPRRGGGLMVRERRAFRSDSRVRRGHRGRRDPLRGDSRLEVGNIVSCKVRYPGGDGVNYPDKVTAEGESAQHTGSSVGVRTGG